MTIKRNKIKLRWPKRKNKLRETYKILHNFLMAFLGHHTYSCHCIQFKGHALGFVPFAAPQLGACSQAKEMDDLTQTKQNIPSDLVIS